MNTKIFFVIVIASLLATGWSQIFPGSYELNHRGQSESGSSATGNCSNVSDSGRVCNTPLTSVLFDGIPTLPGLDGDMWASQLLTLNKSTSTATITFDFNGATDRNGAELNVYTGVETMEVVMFNCPSRGIGVNSIQVRGDNNLIDNIIMPQSCNYLVRGCVDMSLFTTARLISLEFSNMMQTPYIAEITFYDSSARPCASIGPIQHSVEATTSVPTTLMVDTTMARSTADAYTGLPTTENIEGGRPSEPSDDTSLTRNTAMCETTESQAGMSSQIVAASATSFVIGNITGAAGGILILIIINFLVKKVGMKSNNNESDNNIHQVVYDEVNNNKVKSTSDIELQENSAYGHLS